MRSARPHPASTAIIRREGLVSNAGTPNRDESNRGKSNPGKPNVAVLNVDRSAIEDGVPKRNDASLVTAAAASELRGSGQGIRADFIRMSPSDFRLNDMVAKPCLLQR